MKSTCSTIIIGLLASSILSTSNGFVITSKNNNPILNTLSTRLFEGGDDDTTTSSSKPTSRPDFEFSFEVPKKGIGEYYLVYPTFIILLCFAHILCFKILCLIG